MTKLVNDELIDFLLRKSEGCKAEGRSTYQISLYQLDEIIAQAKEANALREQLATARADALEEAAKVAEKCVGGFTANVVVDESEQELIRDADGPWVLNADVAEAIRSLNEKADSKPAQTTKDPIITQAQWDNACAGLGTKP